MHPCAMLLLETIIGLAMVYTVFFTFGNYFSIAGSTFLVGHFLFSALIQRVLVNLEGEVECKSLQQFEDLRNWG